MIRDSELAKIALACTLIGMSLIYIVANFIGPAQVEISSITRDDVGKQVSVNGTVVSSSSNQNGDLFMTLSDGRTNITVVMFSRDADNFKPRAGEKINVVGQINEYKNVLEIIAKKVI